MQRTHPGAAENLEGGATELANYDLNAAVGPMTAVVKEYTLAVSDGTLNIDFTATVNRPIVAAIEVFQLAAGGGAAITKAGLSAPLRQTTPATYTTFLHTDYTYDGVGRLATESSGGSSTAYGYDQVGNRTLVTSNGTSTSRSYTNANQVVGWSYDAAGNLLSSGGATNTYDALGRLTSMGTTTNAYNGDGILVRQQQGTTTTTTTLINDLALGLSQPLIVHRSTPSGQLGMGLPTISIDQSIYGLERIASTANLSTHTWYLADGVGSVQATLDDAGTLLANPQYDAWGIPASPATTPFGFTGEYTDGPSGLVYLRARWYDPSSGTLLGRDPFEGYTESPYSLHPYQYGYSDPVSITDPSGRDPWWNDPNSVNFQCDNTVDYPSDYQRAQCRERERQARWEIEQWNMYGDPLETDHQLTWADACLIGGFAPYLGEGIDFYETVFGKECGTGNDLTFADQALTGLCLGIPFVSGRAIRIGKTIIKPGKRVIPVVRTVKGIVAHIPELIIDSAQFGKKVGKHAIDFGLDPGDSNARQWITDRIYHIRNNADEIRQGVWHPNGGGGIDYYFFKEGVDVIVTEGSGEFVTILKNGIGNGWFQDATQLHP